MQIFLRLQNFASYQNVRAPTVLVKRFSGEKRNLSPAFLIQIEGQEEQQEHEQRGGGAAGQAAKGAAGRAAGGKERLGIWDPEYYRITRKKKIHKYLLFDLKTVGQKSGSGKELLQEIFRKKLWTFYAQIEDIPGFSLSIPKFSKILLYWYSPAARFVAGHFADQIEDIP